METLQPVLAVFLVLALLGGSLYWLRTKGMAQFAAGGTGKNSKRRMRLVERLALTPQHSLHLVKVGGRTLLIAVSPGACSVLEGDVSEASSMDSGTVNQ